MTSKANFIALGAALAAIGVALGAFGAHSLKAVLAAPELAIWETATRYWLFGSLGVLAFGLFRQSRPEARAYPGALLGVGTLLFGLSLYALALGAPRWLGAVTPFGGAGLIAGFIAFACAARQRHG